MIDKAPDSQHRRSGAEETRALILDHARRAFSAASYDEVGVRDIAGAAGVNGALVSRYFGGKRELFEAVLGSYAPGAGDLSGNRETVGSEIAAMFRAKVETPPEVDPLLIMLRSAQCSTVSDLVRASMENKVLGIIKANFEDDPKAEAKTRLISALIFGVDVLDRFLSVPYAEGALDAFEQLFGQTFQSIIDG